MIMARTISLLLIFAIATTYAASLNSERQDTTNVSKNNTVEMAQGVKISADSGEQIVSPIQNDLTSTSSSPGSTNSTAPVANAIVTNSTNSLNTSSTSTTTTTTAVKVPDPKVLINYQFPKLNTTATTKTTSTSTTTEKVIPVNEYEVGEKNDNKKSVAKKGFGANETAESRSSSTTTTKPKKPTVTIGNDDTDSVGNNAAKININFNIEVPTTTKKTDYIVPIVGVILSVPLVAILLNLVYRKTKDWWQYRHYKRMDLIDGIYNN